MRKRKKYEKTLVFDFIGDGAQGVGTAVAYGVAV